MANQPTTQKTNKFNVEKAGHYLVLTASGILLVALAFKGAYTLIKANPQVVDQYAIAGAVLMIVMIILMGFYAKKSLNN